MARLCADGAALPRRARFAFGKSAFGCLKRCRAGAVRSGQGRGQLRDGRWLRPADSKARRICRFRSQRGRLHCRDPVQAPGCDSDRQTGRRGARLRRLGAQRSRRLRDPAVAGAPRHHQHHVRRRAGVHRFAAGHLERAAAGPACRRGPRTGRARTRRRARASPGARHYGGKEARADPRSRLGAADLRPLRH